MHFDLFLEDPISRGNVSGIQAAVLGYCPLALQSGTAPAPMGAKWCACGRCSSRTCCYCSSTGCVYFSCDLSQIYRLKIERVRIIIMRAILHALQDGSPALFTFSVEDHGNFHGSFHRLHGSFNGSVEAFVGVVKPFVEDTSFTSNHLLTNIAGSWRRRHNVSSSHHARVRTPPPDTTIHPCNRN